MIYGNRETEEILRKIDYNDPLLDETERNLLATCLCSEPRDLTPRQKDALGKLWDSLPHRRKPKAWEDA